MPLLSLSPSELHITIEITTTGPVACGKSAAIREILDLVRQKFSISNCYTEIRKNEEVFRGSFFSKEEEEGA